MNKILSRPPFFQYYRQIKSSPNCDIFKTAKYNSHQYFSFYSGTLQLHLYFEHACMQQYPNLLQHLWAIIETAGHNRDIYQIFYLHAKISHNRN